MEIPGLTDKYSKFRDAVSASAYSLQPLTLNPKPEPEPNSRNPKPETRYPKPKARNPKFETQNLKPETRNQISEARNPKPKTRNPKLKTRHPNFETVNSESGTRNRFRRRASRSSQKRCASTLPAPVSQKVFMMLFCKKPIPARIRQLVLYYY